MCSQFHTSHTEADSAGLLAPLTRASDGEEGVIRFREFLGLQHLSAHGSEEEKLRRIFRSCDPGGGRITRADLARVMTLWAGQDMSQVKIVQRLDKHRSYTEEQFLAICYESDERMVNNNIL